jgi:NAD(P)-dependent dehydrogenase (short-subunit alcohol dehydrogenase family)
VAVNDYPPVSGLLDFRGKAVLVTGAGRGIGPGIARRFAEAGANLVVNYRESREGAEAVVAEIESAGGRAVTHQADVSRGEDVNGLFERCLEVYGRLDVLINNAGTYPGAGLLDMSESEWDQVLNDNLRSVHLCTQAAARAMVKQGIHGAIVNNASIEGVSPEPDHSHYDAAKAGVLMHTRSAAFELAPHGIRVNAVSPGLIWQPGIEQSWPEGVARWQAAAPLKRLGLAEDVADACLFLASPAARWITGVNLSVDGGVMVRPAF